MGRIIVAYNRAGAPVTASDLKAEGAMAALLKDALKPNLVQTLEGTPALVHGGPFANIAHGCNSIIATRAALSLADYTVTEAGFGADLGAEKFIDIKCRLSGLAPDAVVLVATIRALKYNGGVAKTELTQENLDALQRGLPNLLKHIENIQNVFHLPVVVAINHFTSDTDAEVQLLQKACASVGVHVVVCRVWEKGGAGGEDLARAVVALCAHERTETMQLCYPDSASLSEKVHAIATRVYGADGVEWSNAAKKQLTQLEALGFGHLPVCIAKTQYSLSDDASQLGRATGFQLHISNLTVSAGAGFVVAMSGAIMKMPGLPKVPAAEKIDVDAEGRISGLF